VQGDIEIERLGVPPSSHDVRYKCAVLLTGKNSVSPWTTARTITCNSGIRYQREGSGGGMSSS